MGIYLRKSVSVGPFRFNLSQRGVGVSVGVKGLRLGSGPRGNYIQMGRGGLYYRAALSPAPEPSRPAHRPTPELPASPDDTVGPMREIESSDASTMVDSSSRELLDELNRKQARIRLWPIAAALSLLVLWVAWSGSWPQWQLAGVALAGALLVGATYLYDTVSKTAVVFYDLDSDLEQAYERLHAAAVHMAACSAVWHVEAQGDVRNSKYHAGAKSIVRRKRTSISKASPPYLKTNIQTVAIGVGRQTLHFFPDRVLVYQAGRVGAVSYAQAAVDAGSTRFIEDTGTPRDATVVGRTWRYVNKDGGPDKRFKNNRQLPVCLYGEMTFSSPTGLNEQIQFSRPDVGGLFAEATRALARAVPVEKASFEPPRPASTPPARSTQPPPVTAPPPRPPPPPLPIAQPAGLPPLSLLDEPKPQPRGWSDEQLAAASTVIESQLKDCRIVAKVVAAYPGPVLTRYELQLGPGVRARQVSALDRDLARWLSVKSVEVVEHIAGKPTIGIDVPNTHRQTVCLSELLHSKPFDKACSPLALALGKTSDGQPAIADLATMPHLLVAGTTGSGKSVALNAMLLSLLYKATALEVRLLLVDTMDAELGVYQGLPHLLAPVITDAKTAGNGLRWCVAEMERRYKIMAALGVRDLRAFNEKARCAIADSHPLRDPLLRQGEAYLEPLPRIVVIIDDFADLVDEADSVAEELALRLTQKAASAGLHLVLATQRPTSGGTAGLLKASIPSRIAFQVASRSDSNAILDQTGAEELLGRGDMLYLPRGSDKPVRIHGAMVSDDEVRHVVDYLRRHSEVTQPEDQLSDGSQPAQSFETPGTPTDTSVENDDPLYPEAVRIVIETGRVSLSGVQRRLRIGYNRSARLLEAMEKDGWISSPDPQGDRTVLQRPR